MEVIGDRRFGLPQPLEEDDPVALAGPLLRPEAETGLIGRDRRHGVGRAFERGVAPGFVVGGEDPEVASGEGLVVGHIDESVVAVEIGRDEDDLNRVLGKILETEALAGLDDGIEALVLQPVGGDGRIRRIGLDVALETGDQVGIAAQDEEKGEDGLVRPHLRVQTGEGFEEEVDPLVVEFAAPRDDHDPGIGGQIPGEETAGSGEELIPGLEGGRAVRRQIGDVLHVEAVRGDQVRRPAEEILRLPCGDLAHRREAVRLAGRRRLHRALGRDVVGARLPLRRDVVHRRVDVHPGGGQGPPEDRRMGGEDGADLRNPLLEAQETRPRHPFVKLGDGPHPLGFHDEVVDGLDHLACRVAEHDRLHVVPPPGDRVDAVILPDPEEELVLVVLLPEAHQDRLGFAGDLPAAEAAGDLLDRDRLADTVPALLVRLLEIGVGLEVRAEEEVILSIGAGRLGELARDDGVDPPDLVADLPAHLEEVVIACLCHGASPSLLLMDCPKSSSMFM